VVLPVPIELQEVLGKKQIWRTLGTKCYANARSLGRRVVAEIDNLFLRVRFGMVSADQIEAIISGLGLEGLQWLENKLSNEDRAIRGRSPKQLSERYSERAEELTDNLAERALTPYEDLARKVVKERRLKITPDSTEFRSLVRELAKLDIEHHSIVAERVKGQYNTEYQHRVISKWEAKKPADKGEPLSKLLADYADAWQGEPYRQKRKHADCNLLTKNLLECLKRDVGVNELGRAELNALNEFWLKKKQLEPKSINNRWELLAAAYNWGNDEGRFKIENPIKRIKLSVPDKRGKRKHLTAKEVLDYMHGLTANQSATRPEKYWIPMLMLHTGARPGELAKLKPADVLEHDGILCLKLSSKKGRNRRADTAVEVVRHVPVAKYLIDIGFCEFVSGCKTVRLFSNCRYEKGSWYPSNLSSEMCGEVRAYTGSSDIDVYSLKHTFKMVAQKCTVRDVLERGRDIPFADFALRDIMGHVQKGHHDGTYGAQQTSIMQVIIDLVDYNVLL
jgi:integrase